MNTAKAANFATAKDRGLEGGEGGKWNSVSTANFATAKPPPWVGGLDG